MNKLEKLIDSVATNLLIVDIDDLPGLARVHEEFLQISREAGDAGIIYHAAKKSAEYVEKIVLNEVADKKEVIAILNGCITAMQSIVRDGRSPAEIHFPPEMGLAPAADNSTIADSAKKEECPEVLSEEKKGESLEVPRLPDESVPGAAAEKQPERLVISLENGDSSLLGEFINEAREHCSTAEQSLIELETNAGDQAAINAIFRGFHTIKGAAGFLELRPISILAHESETLLDLARKGTIQISGHVADMIFDAIDVMRKLLDGTEQALKGNGQFDATEIISSALSTLRLFLEDPGAAPIETPRRVGDILIDMGVVTQPEIDSALAKKENPKEKLGETLVKQGVVPAKVVAHALRSQQKQIADKPSGAVKEMVKIDTERLDRLVDTIGELVIAESMVGQDEEILRAVSPKVARNITHLNKITREIQEMGMAMRLVPVKPTFQKLARAVRDLTRKSGKEIELTVLGEDTEVDRSIVENIGDPLMHMVRNSADHGIEFPEERIKAGKNRVGRITVRAYHKGGNIYFDIEDDGRGLDKEKILAKAREKGIIDGNKELTDKEIYNLILLPGFSTAQKVTDISGRGVGMDVVKKNIDAMRGHLEISSTPGKGTLFSMKLPLTLAIIDGMLVRVEDEKLIIPTLSIVESLSLTKDMIFSVTGKGEMINLRGDLLPLLRICELFALEKAEETDNGKTVVVVEDGLRKVGLVVNELLGQRQTVIKSLGPVFNNQKWIAGGAILSDGTVGLILDVSGIIMLSLSDQAGQCGDKAGFSAAASKKAGTNEKSARQAAKAELSPQTVEI
jgi:two-component system chemotaxis sensor kinase CheA